MQQYQLSFGQPGRTWLFPTASVFLRRYTAVKRRKLGIISLLILLRRQTARCLLIFSFRRWYCLMDTEQPHGGKTAISEVLAGIPDVLAILKILVNLSLLTLVSRHSSIKEIKSTNNSSSPLNIYCSSVNV